MKIRFSHFILALAVAPAAMALPLYSIDPVPDPSGTTFLTYKANDPVTAEAYYAAIDPARYSAPGLAMISSATSVRGCNSDFAGTFVPGDQIEIQGQVRTIKSIGPVTVTSVDDAQVERALPGDTPRRSTGCNVLDLDEVLTVHTPFDPPLSPYVSYQRVGDKTTLTRWEQANQVGGPDSISSVYQNKGDLDFGRRMVADLVNDNGNLRPVYAVTNYTTADEAATQSTTPIATVAMEYTSVPGVNNNNPFIQFYVFGGDGARLPTADLDGFGEKAVPGLCMACHGGTMTAQDFPNTHSDYLPFDLDSFGYSTIPGYSRGNQEATFMEQNARILLADPTPPLQALVNGWYGQPETGTYTSFSPQVLVQNDQYVPLAWQNVTGTQHSSEDLYLDVVKPYCRSCHVAQPAYVDFDSFTEFSNYAPSVQYNICNLTMPHALVTYENFWLDQGPLMVQEYLTDLTAYTWNPTQSGPCKDLDTWYFGPTPVSATPVKF